MDENIQKLLERGVIALESLCFMLRHPGQLTVKLLNKVENKIQFQVVLPPTNNIIVAQREFTLQIADTPPLTKLFDCNTLEINGFDGLIDSTIKVVLVDIDKYGNRSEASVIEVVLIDRF